MSVIGFSFPTPTRFGAGALRELPQHLARLGVRRPLVVTDAGLARLAGLGNLRTLTLSGTRITGAAVATLAKLPRLESVAVAFTEVDDAAVAALAAERPGLTIDR